MTLAQQLLPLNTLLLAKVLQPRCGSQVSCKNDWLKRILVANCLDSFYQEPQKIQLGLLAGLSDIKASALPSSSIHEQPQQASWQSCQFS